MAKIYDSSAILALVFSETGGDKVLQHLIEPGGHISAVNWAEAATKMGERGMRPRDVEQELAHFVLDVVPLDAAGALRAAELRAPTRALGLSLGDRCCLALAQNTPGAAVITADRAWKALKAFDIRLIR